jgi:hypothetical protein
MADLQALYHSFVDCGEVESIPVEPKPMPRGGTFRERLSKQLQPYEMKQTDKAYWKGRALHKMMLADAKTAGQMLDARFQSAESDFQIVKDLQRFGYAEDPTIQSTAALVLIEIGLVLGSIGLDPCFVTKSSFNGLSSVNDDSHNKSLPGTNIAVGHDIVLEDPVRAGQRGPSIISHFMQVVNPDNGIIVAYDNLSPTEAYRAQDRHDFTVPDLKFWSDVAFLQWKLHASEKSELKYVLRYNVLNSVTNFIIEAVGYANDCEMLPWPGVSYGTNSEEGQALLGTPNGSSVAYMLIQHKHQLGHKTVDKITVFENDFQLMLLFHIVDVEA